MNKEEIESLFKKYKVRIPKEKQGQSECYECKRNNKYSLTWTSFLYEYKENYYCFEHIVNILLQQENQELKRNCNIGYENLNFYREESKKYKEVIDKAIDKLYCWGEALDPVFQKIMLDILKEVE